MLVIRQEQLNVLERGTRARLGREVLDRLSVSSPHAVRGLHATERDERMETALRKAEHYGLRNVHDLQAFVRLSFAIGSNFDEYARFKAILTSPDVKPQHRMSRLLDVAESEDWIHAAVHDIVSRTRAARPSDTGNLGMYAPNAKARAGADRGVSLEPLASEHADEYFRLSSHPDVWRLAGLQPFAGAEECARHLETVAADEGTDSFAIVNPDRRFLGAMFLDRDDKAERLWYWVRRSQWGRGIGSTAVRQLQDAMLVRNEIRSLTATTYRSNVLSIRVLEKCGFTPVTDSESEEPGTREFRWESIRRDARA